VPSVGENRKHGAYAVGRGSAGGNGATGIVIISYPYP